MHGSGELEKVARIPTCLLLHSARFVEILTVKLELIFVFYKLLWSNRGGGGLLSLWKGKFCGRNGRAQTKPFSGILDYGAVCGPHAQLQGV